MASKSNYAANYKELEVIGRGNFGSATLVRANDDNNIYVAKKVLLGGLSDKEAEGAHMEVNLLRELKHPHIVEYRDSFVEDNVLIIIMEYCEEGDLAYFIKKKNQKEEVIDEKLVLNWFLQMLLALEFVHRKKILHRDIKSSNIFLRANGTVKLGDFGISRVLENTNEAAMTVVGTPYYMSPEVCENKPYTFKSDVWALGCVIYEMCTLKHAFSASNLLGLVYKIVREQNEPIPTNYSNELSTLVQKLLNKNVNTRPSIRDIFMEPLVQRTIEEFIRTDGQYTTMVKIPVKKTALHGDIKKNGPQGGTNKPNNPSNGDTLRSIMSNSATAKQFDNETPQQRMARRKEEAARAEEERLKQAVRESHLARNQATDRKSKELQGNLSASKVDHSKSMQTIQTNKIPSGNYGSPTGFNNGSPLKQSQQVNNSQAPYQQYNQVRQSNMGYDQDPAANTLNTMASITNASAFGGNNNYNNTMQRNFMEETNQSMAYSQSQGFLANKVQNNTYQHNQFGNYNQQSTYGQGTNNGYKIKGDTGASVYSIKTELELNTGTNYGTNALYRVKEDDRPLPALVNKNNNSKNIAEEDEELYDDDFDDYNEEFEEYWSDEEEADKQRLTVKPNQKDLSAVMNLYKDKLNYGDKESDDDRDTAHDSYSQPEQMAKSQKVLASNAALNKRHAQIEILRNRARQDLGPRIFEEAYQYLKKQRQLNTSDKKIQEELGHIVGKKNLTYCFTIDQIIFLELESM